MSHAITKRQLREQRRAERQAAEAAERARAARRRRLFQLGGAVGLAAIVLAVAIALSSGGGTKPSAAHSAALLRGIPEHNGVLGNASAPTTVTEFIDLQCPICARTSQDLMPSVIRDYVRTGKVKLQARTLHFIGPESETAARFAAGAQAQGRLWPFIEAFYAQQGAENSGYVTDAFLRTIAAESGVNANKALSYAGTAKAQKPLTRANAEAARFGVNGTPTFVVQHGNGTPQVVSADGLVAALGG
jgi:protein-disulfide isomerase